MRKNKIKWYVHLDRRETELSKEGNNNRYSITINEMEGGWNTDSGYEGYGLPKELAQWICDTLNEHGKNCPYRMDFHSWEKNE